MTLAELRALAEADAASADPRRRKAGEYAKKAVERMAAKDWHGATVALAHAITEVETYVYSLEVVDRSKKASFKTPARSSASRENGKKGGRPRTYPQGWRAAKPLTRKPGETRGRKPKPRAEDCPGG